MIIFATITVLVFAYINFWLAFAISRFFMTFHVATNGSASLLSLFLIVFMTMAAMLMVKYYFKIARINLLVLHLKKSSRQLLLSYCIIVTFIGLVLVVQNPWFLNIEDRVQYMRETASFLRAIKLIPIFLLALLIDDINKNRRPITIFILYSLFIVIYGSKSGMIFCIIHIITLYHFNVIKVNAKNILSTVLLFVFLVLAMYIFFVFLSIDSGLSVSDSILNRLLSDTTGISLSQSMNKFEACVNYNLLNPLLNFLKKISISVELSGGYLSFGQCLASPYDASYPFELLVPLIFELNYIYGPALGSVLFPMLLLLHSVLIWPLFWILSKKRWGVLKSALAIYSAFSIFSIIFGGKFFNWFVSEYISIVFVCLFILILDALLPKRARAMIGNLKTQENI